MITNPFIDWLPDVATDTIVIDPARINTEANGNLWTFSVTSEQAMTLTPDDVEAFVRAVVTARNGQLTASNSPPMLFYCWHDAEAAQLRVSLVSEKHGCLPFQCALDRSASLRLVATSFLRSQSGDGTPLPELSAALPVWVTRLPLELDGNSTSIK